MIDKIVIDKFKNIANYPMDEFLVQSREFFSNDYPKFILFFSGKINFIDKSLIKRLNVLSEQSIILSHIWRSKKNLFQTVDFWELLDTFEDIKTKFETTHNISRYLRSSIIANSNKAGFVFNHNLVREETLESISRQILDQTSYEEDWVNIALDNDLKEINYDIEGGNNLKLRKQLFQADLVTSMIDNTIGEKIYGKDIKRFFTYKDNDLESLDYKETVFQTAEILSELSKGDIPEFPVMGMDTSFYKGANQSQLNYPSIVRELNKNFQSDDLFTNFSVKKITQENGDIFIEYQVDTKYELVIIKNITI